MSTEKNVTPKATTKRATVKRASAKTENPFITSGLADLDKSIKDIRKEKIVEFLETAAIDCEGQIADREVILIPKKERELKTAEQALVKAEKNLTATQVKVPFDGSLQTYLDTLYQAESGVSHAEKTVEAIKYQIETLKKEVVKLKEILARFKA